MAVTSGVDLAREERIAKCDAVIDTFEKVSRLQNIEKILKKLDHEHVILNLIIASLLDEIIYDRTGILP